MFLCLDPDAQTHRFVIALKDLHDAKSRMSYAQFSPVCLDGSGDHLWTQTPVVDTCVTLVWNSFWTTLPSDRSSLSQVGASCGSAGAQTYAGSLALLRALEKLLCSELERPGRQKSLKHLLKFSSKKA